MKRNRDLMLEDIHTYNDEQEKQIKNEKQEHNWIDSSEIQSKWETLKKNAVVLYNKKRFKIIKKFNRLYCYRY